MKHGARVYTDDHGGYGDHRYVDEFVWRRNVRDLDTMDQTVEMVRGMAGKRLRYRELVA